MTTTNTTHAYFDLHEYISNITCADVAAQMASSAAFAVDVAICGAARQLMKNLRTYHVDHGIDSLSEMTACLEDLAFVEEVMAAAGKEDLGPVATIVQLNAVREQWHALASELTGMTFNWDGTPRVYRETHIEDMLTREVKLDVKPQTEHRIRVQVERRADSAGKEDIETVFQKRLAREQARAKDMAKTLTAQSGAVLTAYQVALAHGEASEVCGFHELDAQLRAQLINAALKGAARAEDYATSSRSITDDEFDQISFAVIKVERELKAVLNGPAYKVQRAMAPV